MSYDEKGMIAFELMKSQSLWNRAVSYDLHGDVHPQINARSQSLWNRAVSYDLLQKIKNLSLLNVSIPLEQGSVLRQNYQILSVTDKKSQSLWNRAVSYDAFFVYPYRAITTSQSLWNRAVSYDSSGVIKPCATRLAEATSQLFPRLRELGLDLVKC